MTTVEASSKTEGGGAGKGKGKPPEWWIERVVKAVGRGPAVLGRGLDRLAKVPVLGVVVRFFSSVWVGIVFLLLLGIYIGIGSGFPALRAQREMTDLQFFDWYPMQAILAGLAITLTIVTLRRIPLTVFKLGVWMVHVGILTLIGGAVWYFSHKIEGSVRIFIGKSVDSFYDATERALYAYRIGPDGKADGANGTMTPLPTLPIFYEHLEDQDHHNPLNMLMPAGATAGLGKGFENLRVRITGYYPAADLMPIGWRLAQPGERGGSGRAIGIEMDSSNGPSPEAWLIANSPAERVLQLADMPFGMEYLLNPSPERFRTLTSPFSGPVGLMVRVPGKHVEAVYGVKAGDVINVTGTPYTLTIGDVNGMPMRSKGYENAFSTALTVHVARNTWGWNFHYDRMVLFRYPERSPDFVMESGSSTRVQDGVDDDIQMEFVDASQPQFWVVENADASKTMVSRFPSGKVTVEKFGKDGSASMAATGRADVRLKIIDETDNAVRMFSPLIIPPEQRQRGETAMDAMQDAIVSLRVEKGDGTGWVSEEAYVPFVQFAQVGEGPGSREPTVVYVPGVGHVGFLLSTVKRSLPSVLTLRDFEAVKYPGALNSYENFISTLDVKPKDGGEGVVLTPQLNDPAADHGLYYFQAGWAGADATGADRFSIIGVGNRPGIWVMCAGAVLMVLGIGYSFYVKPVLLRVKKAQLAAWAAEKHAEA